METINETMTSITGIIMRHGPDPETRNFVAMATCLGNGIWATVGEKVYGGTVYDKKRGDQELIDLYIHPLGSNKNHPIEWGYNGVLKPLALLYSSGTENIQPIGHAPAYELTFPEYRRIWRHSFGGWNAFTDMEFDHSLPTEAVPGSIMSKPTTLKYSPDAESHSLIILGDMKYPGKKNGGSPILSEDGRLAGMLIGPNYQPGSQHTGWYMPVDYIHPSFEMVKVCAKEENRKMRPYIDWATHLSSKIYY